MNKPLWTHADLGFQEIWGWKHDLVAYLVMCTGNGEWSASVKDLLTGRVHIFPDQFSGLSAGKALCEAKHRMGHQ